MSEYLYVEKYRPHKIEDCILPDRLTNVIQEYAKNGEFQPLTQTGPAGCGKTTVARAMMRRNWIEASVHKCFR